MVINICIDAVQYSALTLVFITGFLTVSLLFISAILMLAREPILSGVSWGLTSRLFPRREEKLVELLPSKSKLIE